MVWLNSTNTLTVSGVVSGTWSTGFYSSGGYHTIALTNPTNDFTGNYNATLNSTIQFNTIANKGVNSSLGAGTQIIFDLSDVQSFNGGFENIGAGGSTDRDVILGQHNGTPWARIDNNGTGALDFNGTFTNLSNAGATRNLRLGGDYAGENTISSVLSDGGNGGQLAITKDGSTTWILTGDNTHTGPTAVNGGTLLANNTTGSATGAGVVNVNSGGTLGGTGTVSGATTVAASGAVAPATAALTFTDGLTLQPDSLLNMRLVTAGNHARVVISGGSAAYTTSGPVSVNVLGAPAEGEYTLVDGTGIGTWETDISHYTLEVPVGYTGELRIVDQTLVLTLALPKAAFITIR